LVPSVFVAVPLQLVWILGRRQVSRVVLGRQRSLPAPSAVPQDSMRKTSCEARNELRVAVADQEPDVLERVGDPEVAGLLGDPPAVRVGGRAGEVDAAVSSR
jgi:hypothetical protein